MLLAHLWSLGSAVGFPELLNGGSLGPVNVGVEDLTIRLFHLFTYLDMLL